MFGQYCVADVDVLGLNLVKLVVACSWLWLLVAASWFSNESATRCSGVLFRKKWIHCDTFWLEQTGLAEVLVHPITNQINISRIIVVEIVQS